MMRRSRGYVPQSVRLPLETRGVLGCGAELKSTFCVAKGERAWPSHHIGDLKNWETLDSFREGVEHFQRLFAVEPQVIAHDLHPDYLSSRYAQERAEEDPGLELVGVQHHHAHLAACLAEHGETGRRSGVIFDGTGYGEDASVWGGELLDGDLAGFERVGMLMPVRLPGGDRAVQGAMADGGLVALACARRGAAGDAGTLRDEVDAAEWEAVCGIVQTGAGSPVTTSAGRLFDAVSALCGIRARVTLRGPGRRGARGRRGPGGARRVRDHGEGGGDAPLVLDPRPAIRASSTTSTRGRRWRRRRSVPQRARDAVRAAELACRERGLDRVVLSGGVFQNRLLVLEPSQGLDRRACGRSYRSPPAQRRWHRLRSGGSCSRHRNTLSHRRRPRIKELDHEHDEPHTHEHSHDGETHSHPHDDHDHEHVEHVHEHTHDGETHTHPHVHQKGLEHDDAAHDHEH